MIWIERRTGHGCNSHRLHQKKIMNKIDEYKNKINYNVWEDIAPLKIRDRREDPKKIEAIRKVILGCSSDGGEI